MLWTKSTGGSKKLDGYQDTQKSQEFKKLTRKRDTDHSLFLLVVLFYWKGAKIIGTQEQVLILRYWEIVLLIRYMWDSKLQVSVF